jgi:hypothetical protein
VKHHYHQEDDIKERKFEKIQIIDGTQPHTLLSDTPHEDDDTDNITTDTDTYAYAADDAMMNVESSTNTLIQNFINNAAIKHNKKGGSSVLHWNGNKHHGLILLLIFGIIILIVMTLYRRIFYPLAMIFMNCIHYIRPANPMNGDNTLYSSTSSPDLEAAKREFEDAERKQRVQYDKNKLKVNRVKHTHSNIASTNRSNDTNATTTNSTDSGIFSSLWNRNDTRNVPANRPNQFAGLNAQQVREKLLLKYPTYGAVG